MMSVFPHNTIKTSSFLSLLLLITFSIAFGCKQDQKTTVASPQTEPATAPATRQEVAPAEDYSAVIMQVARKEYEPLGRRILATREQVRAAKSAARPNSEISTTGGARDYEKNQSKVEADFVENMKMLDYIQEKQNSKEMTTEQSAAEKIKILKNIKELETATMDLEKALNTARH